MSKEHKHKYEHWDTPEEERALAKERVAKEQEVKKPTAALTTRTPATASEHKSNPFTTAIVAAIVAVAVYFILKELLGNSAYAISPASSSITINASSGDTAQAIEAIRWGIFAEPAWTFGTAQTAPAAGSVLVRHSVATGEQGYIFGFFLSTQEPNDFLIQWTAGGAAMSLRVVFSSKASLESVDPTAMNRGVLADPGTDITISNVNAGGAGMVYQAGLLIAEI